MCWKEIDNKLLIFQALKLKVEYYRGYYRKVEAKNYQVLTKLLDLDRKWFLRLPKKHDRPKKIKLEVIKAPKQRGRPRKAAKADISQFKE